MQAHQVITCSSEEQTENRKVVNWTDMAYLTAYNGLSFVLWTAVLADTLAEVWTYFYGSPTQKLTNIYYNPHAYYEFPHKTLVYVQVLSSSLEILHSVLGLVRLPLSAQLLQASARLFITVGVSYTLPESPGNGLLGAYASMTIAWAVTELIRFGFYGFKTMGSVPKWALWLRYLAFLVLYPVGLLSELVIAYSSLEVAGSAYRWFIWFGLTLYLPGFVFLFGHMLRQRRKVLCRKGPGRRE